MAVVLFMVSMLVSCRKDLCYDHYPVINISFAWEHEWERDYGSALPAHWDSEYYGFDYDALRPTTPEWVALVRYAEGEEPDERYLAPNGGRLVVNSNESRRSYLFYNGDTEYIVFSDMASSPGAFASATSRSRSTISSVVERHPNSRTTNQPDNLYAAFIKNVPEVKSHEQKPLPVKMQPLVYTYIVRYEFEYGLQHVSLARGALGGMAESVYLRDGITSEESSIILFDCEMKPYGCEAHVRSFGIPGFPDEYYGRTTRPEDRPYTLNLEVMLKNGKTVEFNFDVSDQLFHQPRGGVVKVSGLRIEDEQNVFDSGFDVDVNEWGNHDIIDLPVFTN